MAADDRLSAAERQEIAAVEWQLRAWDLDALQEKDEEILARVITFREAAASRTPRREAVVPLRRGGDTPPARGESGEKPKSAKTSPGRAALIVMSFRQQRLR